MSDAADDTPADVEVEAVDVGEAARNERVRSLFEARDRVREIRTETKLQRSGRETKRGAAEYRAALETYVREAQPLLEKTTRGRELWSDETLGVVTVSLDTESFDGDTNALKIAGTDRQISHDPGPVEVEVTGLKTLFGPGRPIQAEIPIPVPQVSLGRRPNQRQRSEPYTVSRDLPFDILDEIFSATNSYLADIGLGIEVESEEEWKI
jgi:hypothetical protein